MAAIRAIISRRRHRPIGVTLSDQLPARALYARAADLDLLVLDRRDSPIMRVVGEAHELGHLICDHPTTPLHGPAAALNLPDLDDDLVLSIRGRFFYGCADWADWNDDLTEAEAELTGRLLVRHLLHAPGAGLAVYLDEC
jgi:hypothetical protein